MDRFLFGVGRRSRRFFVDALGHDQKLVYVGKRVDEICLLPTRACILYIFKSFV